MFVRESSGADEVAVRPRVPIATKDRVLYIAVYASSSFCNRVITGNKTSMSLPVLPFDFRIQKYLDVKWQGIFYYLLILFGPLNDLIGRRVILRPGNVALFKAEGN